MVYTAPAVVIDNGSHTTKAGFALEDLPSLVFSSNYAVDSEGKVIVGDEEIASRPDCEVMTLMDNGLIYNFENITHNWEYIYKHMDNQNGVDPKEYPLMITQHDWNTPKNKMTTAQIAFETLQVPIFSLVKTPLVQLYHVGKSTGLVIDVGSSNATVTPILDGIIQSKSSFSSKFAGDFANLHALNYLQKYGGLDALLPKRFLSTKATESFKNYQISHYALEDFKLSMLSVAEGAANQYQYPVTPKSYQLPNGSHVSVYREQIDLMESLFQPQLYQIPGVAIPEPAMDKPLTHGIITLILSSLKTLEGSFAGEHQTPNKFGEVLRELCGNILITGGSSLTTGFSQRILNDLYRSAGQLFAAQLQGRNITFGTLGNHHIGDIQDTWDRKFSAWKGATNLASMLNDYNGEADNLNIALENWFVTKSDYEEMGEDLILEKFK
jgi:actin-related protein 7